MHRRQQSFLGLFFASLLVLAMLYYTNPSTFFADEHTHFWVLAALITGLFTMGEELLDGASLTRSMAPLLQAGVGVLIFIGIVWYMINQPIQIFPAHTTTPAHSGSSYLPNIFR